MMLHLISIACIGKLTIHLAFQAATQGPAIDGVRKTEQTLRDVTHKPFPMSMSLNSVSDLWLTPSWQELTSQLAQAKCFSLESVHPFRFTCYNQNQI